MVGSLLYDAAKFSFSFTDNDTLFKKGPLS